MIVSYPFLSPCSLSLVLLRDQEQPHVVTESQELCFLWKPKGRDFGWCPWETDGNFCRSMSKLGFYRHVGVFDGDMNGYDFVTKESSNFVTTCDVTGEDGILLGQSSWAAIQTSCDRSQKWLQDVPSSKQWVDGSLFLEPTETTCTSNGFIMFCSKKCVWFVHDLAGNMFFFRFRVLEGSFL